MTYNKSLQGRFVGSVTPVVVMFAASLVLWITGAVLGTGSATPTLLSLAGLNFVGDFFARFLSLLAFLSVALVLNHLYLFERRVHWLSPLFMWLSAVCMFAHVDYLSSISSLFLVLSIAQLLSCVQEAGQERSFYGAFALLSFSSLFLLQFLYLLPLFVAYLFIARISRVKNMLAALLGTVTPWWLLLGMVYVFPSLDTLLLPARMCYENIVTGAEISYTALPLVIAGVEVLALVVAVGCFVVSSLPAKPLLRHRLLFIMLLNIYLLLLSFALPQDYMMFLVWRLPGLAILVSYTLSMRVTKLSNFYFIFLNVVWLFIAGLCLWIG